MIELLSDKSVVQEIEYVAKHFIIISEFIEKVEKEMLPTIDFLDMLADLEKNLEAVPNLPDAIREHFFQVLFIICNVCVNRRHL